MVCLGVLAVGVAMFGFVFGKPVEDVRDVEQKVHHLWKRFIDPALASGFYNINDVSRIRSIRTRRSPDEDCEKLELCRLHAQSSRNPLAAFELYFVNKENARLWDHQSHATADCNQRFAHCFGAPAQPKPSNEKQIKENRSIDNYKEFRSDDYAQYSDY